MQKSGILSSSSEYIDLSAQANESAAKDNDLPSHYDVNVLERDMDTIASILRVPEGSNRENYLRTCVKIGAMALNHTAS